MEKNTTIAELLHKRGLKATRFRIDFTAFLQAHKSAISLSAMQKKFAEIDRVTMYRTIQTFLDAKLIHRAYEEKGEQYYALCGDTCSEAKHEHEHIHFKCNQCNEVSCVEMEDSFDIALPQYKVENININISGVCQSCLG